MSFKIGSYEIKILEIKGNTLKFKTLRTSIRYTINFPFNLDERDILTGMVLKLEISDSCGDELQYTIKLRDGTNIPIPPLDARTPILNKSLNNPIVSDIDVIPDVSPTPSMENVRAITEQYGMHCFYHITRVENLAGVIENGLMCRNKFNNCVDISNAHIQDARHLKRVPPYPRLFLHDFALMFVAPKPPMLSVLREQQANIVYLCYSSKVLQLPWTVFTDGNARSNATKFYTDLNDFSKLNWTILRAHYWNADDEVVHQENKRQRSAEVMIRDCVPASYLAGILVQNQSMLVQVNDILNQAHSNIPAWIKSEYYYPTRGNNQC
jgi:hypothetical protein